MDFVFIAGINRSGGSLLGRLFDGHKDFASYPMEVGFKFDDDEAFDDDIIDFGKFKVLIDSMSYPYLYGSTLDFVEDLSGAKFVIENPNAKTTCGCGESFTV